MILLYLPTQIRFLIEGEHVTCHWSKLHDALGRTKLHDALGQQQLELSTHTWSGRAPLKRRQICTPADVKQIIFICVLFYFELEGITKHLMTGPSGNSEFCFPSTSMFPSASPRGNKTHCFPWGQSLSAYYYMTSSVSGQDEPNRALWLATRAGKMERYCPLGISRLVPQDQRSFFGVLSHIINPLLTKLVWSRWLDIGLVLFLRVYWPRLRLGP